MQHRWGGNSTNFPLELLDEFYDELLAEDIEHVCVALEHESAWNLGAYSSGTLVYENVEEGEPRHMKKVSKERVVELWKLLAEGNFDELEKLKWENGYH